MTFFSQKTNVNDNNASVSVEDAIQALYDRGVTGATDIALNAEPALIVAWCQHWDRQKATGAKVGIGLLVRHIRSGEQPPIAAPPPSKPRRPAVWNTAALPILYRSHQNWLDQRRYPDECAGDLMTVDAAWPVLTLECDECGELFGLPARKVPAQILEQLEAT